MSNNPLLNHAQLWGYWNSDAWNGDEFNGAGKNLPVSPMQFDTFDPFPVFLVTSDMMSVFDGCADLTPRSEPSTVVVPQDDTVLFIRHAA